MAKVIKSTKEQPEGKPQPQGKNEETKVTCCCGCIPPMKTK